MGPDITVLSEGDDGRCNILVYYTPEDEQELIGDIVAYAEERNGVKSHDRRYVPDDLIHMWLTVWRTQNDEIVLTEMRDVDGFPARSADGHEVLGLTLVPDE